MGSASVDLKGNIGMPLKVGDVLGVEGRRVARATRTFQPWQFTGDTVTLRITPGPQASDEALAALTKQTFTVSNADRMGLRLADADVPGGELTSEAVPIGAIQVPSGANPILLLHDRGTIGGYFKPAVLHPADLPRAAQIRQGQKVRFRLLDEAC
jgi:allophanate hydrolase subunit 2